MESFQIGELSHDTNIRSLAAEMKNTDAPAGARVRAADVVLSRLMNLKELSELEARVAELEATVKGETER